MSAYPRRAIPHEPGDSLPAALLVLRLTIASFLFAWASLKFTRPEWMVNVWTNNYGQAWVTADYAYAVGTAQVVLVLAFASGLWRTLTYGVVTLMHATGIASASAQLLDPTSYPKNLLWAAVPTLGAMVALFLLRRHDDWVSLSGRAARRAVVETDARTL